MSTEVLDFVADNASLPFDTDLKSTLIAHANVLTWAQPAPEHCTVVSGAISKYANVKGGADLYLAPGTDSTFRAAIATDATLNNWEGATFDGVNDTYLWQGAVPDFSGEYFVAALVKTAVATGVRGVFGRPAAGATQSSLYQTGTTFQVSHRSASVNLKTGVAAGAWALLLWSGNGTTLRGSTNAAAASVSTVATGALTTAAPNFGSLIPTGSFWSGQIADIWTGSKDILNPADADAVALRAMLLKYSRDVYGLALT